MKLKIENVGIIKDSEINLNGLTLITGPNNSGKTTVGKVLYSLITAMENIDNEAFKEKKAYAYRKVRDIYDRLGLTMIYRSLNDEKKEKDTLQIHFEKIFKSYSLVQLTTIIEDIIDILKERINERTIKDSSSYEDTSIYTLSSFNYKISQNAIYELLNLKSTLEADPELKTYSNNKILKILNEEFNHQIAPVKNTAAESKIMLFEEKHYYFKINSLEEKNEKFCNLCPFEQCYFIDDINILNKLEEAKLVERDFRLQQIRYNSKIEFDDFLYNTKVITHEQYLSNALLKHISLYEEGIYQQETQNILDKISKEFSSNILYKNRSFICDADGLNIKNLASGTKLFAIIKTLIQKGALNDKTVLVLDEPENHLHPEWQNQLAEILVLLVKHLNTRIIITTHSPTFLLALETMVLQYDLSNKTSAYLSKKCEDNYMVNFEDITANLNLAYEHLNLPYITMNMLYEKLSEQSEE